MRFAVIEVPDFSLQAILRLEPTLYAKPVAVTTGEGRRACIACANDVARSHGVELGMGSVQALAECAELSLRLGSLPAEREASAVMLQLAWCVSPRVEQTLPGICTLDLAGRSEESLRVDLKRLQLQLQGHGLPVGVGVADTPLTARFAAHVASPEKWVADSESFLSALPLSLLEPTKVECELFHNLGIRTLGDITRMPRESFAQRFGLRGSQLWSKAAGEESRPLHTAVPPACFEASLDFEQPADTLDPLFFVLRRFVDRLAADLNVAGLAAEVVELRLRLEDETAYERSFRLPEVTAKADALFAVLENHLVSVHTESLVIGVDLTLRPARVQHRQNGLFDLTLKDPPAFYDTLARAGAVLGEGRVGTPQRETTHRPDAVGVVAPAAVIAEFNPAPAAEERGPLLRRFRPPYPAMVELNGELPRYLSSQVTHGSIVSARGPFLLSGEWWERRGWSREEWDVELAGNGLYRLLNLANRWFVEGIYD